jgi:hypothetical protein
MLLFFSLSPKFIGKIYHNSKVINTNVRQIECKKKKPQQAEEEEEKKEGEERKSAKKNLVMSMSSCLLFFFSAYYFLACVSIELLLLSQIAVIALSLISIGLFCRGKSVDLLLS